MALSKLLPVVLLFCCINAGAQVIPASADSVKVDDRVFTKVEVEAEFPGGVNAWSNYLKKNLDPNVPADNGAPAGKYSVVIKFIISRDGSVSGIAPETNLGYGMEAEVIRIIKRSGNWTPAYQNKRAVNAYRRQPVTFMMIDDDFDISTKVPYTLFTGQNIIQVDAGKKNRGHLKISISQGSITPTDEEGEYTVRLTEPGRVIITIHNSKNNKKIGDASFEVKQNKQ